MRTLIIIAHGSRRQASNDEIYNLLEQHRPALSPRFDVVTAAFLELADPDIITAMNTMVEQGAASITLVPWFLAAGVHVTTDIPDIVGEWCRSHPEVTVRITSHIGSSEFMSAALTRLLENPSVPLPGKTGT